LQNHVIGTFYLVVSLWMCDGRPVHADMWLSQNSRNFLLVN
jgi:hypothetical protein